MSGRVLALDVGDRRIGVAVSDPTRTLASSLDVLKRRGLEEDLTAIVGLVEHWAAGTVVVGFPRSLDGSVGPQARLVEAFAQALAERVSVPVVLWDERLSTVSAARLLTERGKSTRQQRKRIDSVAAAIILQSYLDAASLQREEEDD